ncbi:histidine phosphatase family protein [Bacillus sp. UMB0893]|uniref:histidine phosphatase family protein n=1 Tax=Bacillus sp. UMB0893 TaxID=2066053 RepID=UPI000C793F33|nr:histidine phosphatase family protein [Bacillus sp. UMB0893]PLR69029.1 histidine phosphatase family protein [Bacillus sp. UMB0893]
MTKLGIVRHGRTAWNLERRAQGSSDIPLDELGIAEAEKLAERLGAEDWDMIYASPLLRARQTAEYIAARLGNLPIQFDSRIREVSGGQIEGTTEAERIEKWGEQWRELDLGMEKANLVIERGMSFFEEITSKHPGKNILIVSHGSFIKHCLKKLVPKLEMEEGLKNTSISTIVKVESVWNCDVYNCTRHLAEQSQQSTK